MFSQIRSEQIEEKIQKPWWFKINKPEFEELTGDIYNNQNNKDFKIIINKKTYDLKNTKNVWAKITKSEISKNEAKKLYKELIQKDFDAPKRKKSKSTKKDNILKLFEDINAIFTGTYLHYGELFKETKFERNIADRVKLRKQKLDIINKNKEKINCLKNTLIIQTQTLSSKDLKMQVMKEIKIWWNQSTKN